jgi:RNA polymerase sigma factor (sigma-70 family)
MTNINIDENIISDFMAGSTDALKNIYDQTFNFVFNVIFKMVSSKEDAEDLTHDIYLKIYEKRNTYKNTTKFTTWLYRIAVNHTLNHIRRKKFFLTNILQFLVNNYGFITKNENTVIEKEETVNLVHNLLSKINEKNRICLVLKDLEDKSYIEIAEILNISIGNVKTRIHRGRQELAKLYKKEGH